MMSLSTQGQMTSKVILLVMTLLSLLLAETDSKTVVFLSAPHIANVRTYTNAARALAALGHDVYVPVPEAMLKAKVVNTAGVKVIEYGTDISDYDHNINAQLISKFWNNETAGLDDIMWALDYCHQLEKQMLADQKLVGKLREIKPDLFVLTNVPPFRNMVVFPYMLDVPFAFLCPFADYIGQRSPFSLSSSPTQLNTEFRKVGMSFFQRMKHSMMNLGMVAMHMYVTSDATVAEFAPHRPKVTTDEIMTKAEIFLIESDPVMDYARPQLDNTKFIGSMAGGPAGELKEPFRSFVDNARHGVVVVTFGSIVSEFPDYVSSKLISAFLQLQQNIVWRAANVVSPEPTKLMTSSWVPQNEILAHRNTKLFVSHCGANGQYEALYHGVPTLCLPFAGDQPHNAQRGVVKGFGLKADIRQVTSEELLALMKEIIENGSYKENIVKASSLYKELYKLPVNQSAYWLDHVMRFGGEYMRSPGQHMSVVQFLDLDIFAFAVFVVAVVVVAVWLSCRVCCRLCCGKGSKSKVD